MKNFKSFLLLTAIIASLTITSCSSFHKKEEKINYGEFSTAVTFSANQVYGAYGRKLPEDFNSEKFMSVVKGKIPEEYYILLKKYNLNVISRKSYYLLIADKDGRLILFDYSCSPELDGPVYEDSVKYNAANMESFDVCKPHQKNK